MSVIFQISKTLFGFCNNLEQTVSVCTQPTTALDTWLIRCFPLFISEYVLPAAVEQTTGEQREQQEEGQDAQQQPQPYNDQTGDTTIRHPGDTTIRHIPVHVKLVGAKTLQCVSQYYTVIRSATSHLQTNITPVSEQALASSDTSGIHLNMSTNDLISVLLFHLYKFIV